MFERHPIRRALQLGILPKFSTKFRMTWFCFRRGTKALGIFYSVSSFQHKLERAVSFDLSGPLYTVGEEKGRYQSMLKCAGMGPFWVVFQPVHFWIVYRALCMGSLTCLQFLTVLPVTSTCVLIKILLAWLCQVSASRISTCQGSPTAGEHQQNTTQK